jgi:hypothetical protein
MKTCRIYTISVLLILSILMISCSDETVTSNLYQDSGLSVDAMDAEEFQLQISGELYQVLTAPDAAEGAGFGRSTAVDKHTAVIGAPFHINENNVQTGAAYVFSKQKSQWQHEATLSPDVEEFGTFGMEVAIDKSVIAVTSGNSVYVFERKGNSWILVSKLEPEEEDDPRDQYGASLDVNGKYIAVGDPDFRDFGSVHIYERKANGWQFSERIFASNGSVADAFGTDVSLSGNSLLTSSSLINAGYIFDRRGENWNESYILVPDDPAPLRFGASVSVSGNTAVIGRPLDNDIAVSAGAAYIFEKSQNSWNQVKKLTDPAGNEEDRLGQTVAIDTRLIAVGSPGAGAETGKAFFVKKQGNNWSDLMSLESNVVQPGDQFGFSVAVSMKTVLVGAPGDGQEASNAGKVYVYE